MPYLTTFISNICPHFIPVEQYEEYFYRIAYVYTQIAFNHKSSRSISPANIKYIHSSNTSTTFYKVSTGYMFRPTCAIIKPYI